MAALAVPEICGALESPGGEADGKKYAAWFDAHVSPRYSVRGTVMLHGWDVYRFRCRVLHQPTHAIPSTGLSRIVFIEPGMTGVVPHNHKVFDMLNIDVRIFIEDVVEAGLLWLERAQHTAAFAGNMERFARRYPDGLPPYIAGSAIIA